MKTISKILLVALILPFFVSCKKDIEDDNNYNYLISIATVENTNQSSNFYFRLDNNDLMLTSQTNLPLYIPKDGQRIIANYTILNNKVAGSPYNYDVKLNDVYEVLTKDIFTITSAKQDSIGNDSVQIQNIWIGSDYLNVEFIYPGYDKVHYINLVTDPSKVYTDGKTHLEFRHNANGDKASYLKSGIVSFNLNSLKKASKDTIDLLIHVNAPNVAAEKTYSVTYSYGVAPALLQSPKFLLPANRTNKVK